MLIQWVVVYGKGNLHCVVCGVLYFRIIAFLDCLTGLRGEHLNLVTYGERGVVAHLWQSFYAK